MALVKKLMFSVVTLSAVVIAFLYGALLHHHPHHRLIVTTLSPFLSDLDTLLATWGVSLHLNVPMTSQKQSKEPRNHKLPEAQHLSSYFEKEPPAYLNDRDNQELEYEYCEAIFPSKDNWKRPANPNFKLQRITTIFRHGDRTPVRKFPFAEKRVQYQCDKGIWPKHIVDDYHFTKEALAWNGTCTVGQLTSRGKRQLSSLGKRFREVYFSNDPALGMWWLNEDGHGVDSNNMDAYEQSIDDAIYIRSTDVP
jgi:hypothetical protein